MARDVVCGMEVDESTATETAEYEGTTYYFCCKGCRMEFEDSPEKYLSGEGGGGHAHGGHQH